MCFLLVFLGLVVVFSYGMGNVSAAGNTSGNNIYVDTHGNDTWNGQSATHQAGTLTGPKQSIKNATGIVNKGGTVNIANGLYKGAKNTNITINKNMILKGQSETGTIINGTDTNWIFHISPGIIVTITNLTLTNGKSDNGSAIYNQGSMNIINSTFTTNNAVGSGQNEHDGGAIYNTGYLSINNGNFNSNTAIGGEFTIGYGGAIYNRGNLIVYKSNFIGNKVNSNRPGAGFGGAIYNIGNLTANYTTFKNNTATGTSNGYGGAIYNGGNFTLTASTFTGNSAIGGMGSSGGAIYNTGPMAINNSTFNENSVGGGTSQIAGAIFNNGGSVSKPVTITNTKFQKNTTTGERRYAGAIYNYGTLCITNSTFSDCSSYQGGAITNSGNLIVKSSIFTNNTSEQGAIDNSGTLTVTTSTFNNNSGDDCGVILNSGTLTVTCSTMEYNRGVDDAGAIVNTGTANIHFNRIIGNTASSGYSIYTWNGGKTDASLNWWGSNAGPKNNVFGNVTATPWLVLTITGKPTTIGTNSKSTITADLLHDNKGIYHNPANGCVNNGLQLTFASKYGTLTSPSSTVNGCAISTFKSGTKTGTAAIYTKLDNQTIKTLVTIKK
jgi:autotransporter family porin